MPTIDVEDPGTGRSIRLALVTVRGKKSLKRVPESTYDLSKASPQRLEALAAFAEAASAAHGRKMTGAIPPSAEEVRASMRARMPTHPRAPTARELRQEYYRSLVPPEERELLETMHRQQIPGRVAPRKIPLPPSAVEAALPRRPIPLPPR